MRFAGGLLTLAVLAGAAAPAEALSIGPPDCRDFDRGLRQSPNVAVVRIVQLGETRREDDTHITPVRAVIREVVKGRDVRRDQMIAWEDRVDEGGLELFGMDRPHYSPGVDQIATIGADGGLVQLWAPVEFYKHNLRTCYRRSLVSPAG